MVIALTQTLACATATTTTDDGVTDAVQSAGGARNGDEVPTPDFCGVQRLLQDKCQRCHADPPLHGAPFALVTYADTQTLDRHDQPRYLAMQKAIEEGSMPAMFIKLDPPVAPLDDDEKQLLLDWCTADAPSGNCR
ncbi:MAG TPA: hypothetical protein VHB79_03015 [Polyangiaceae bacterium]|nr:hypothetical protein [Polyangiaceae bacterium]